MASLTYLVKQRQMVDFDQNLEISLGRKVNMFWQTGSAATNLDITKGKFMYKIQQINNSY